MTDKANFDKSSIQRKNKLILTHTAEKSEPLIPDEEGDGTRPPLYPGTRSGRRIPTPKSSPKKEVKTDTISEIIRAGKKRKADLEQNASADVEIIVDKIIAGKEIIEAIEVAIDKNLNSCEFEIEYFRRNNSGKIIVQKTHGRLKVVKTSLDVLDSFRKRFIHQTLSIENRKIECMLCGRGARSRNPRACNNNRKCKFFDSKYNYKFKLEW